MPDQPGSRAPVDPALDADPAADGKGGGTPADRAHGAVTVLWALAVLVHLLGNPAQAHGQALPAVGAVVVLLVAVLATGLALRPHDRRLAAAAAVAVAVLAVLRLPVLANNLVLLAVTGAALQLRGSVRPVLRVGATAYAFAAFAKLNTGFLDQAVSCGPELLTRLVGSWGLGVPPAWALGAAAPAALAVEGAVAVGLLVPRTRRAAATLGVLFHGLLAFDLDQHFWDFTAALLPVFAAAAPAVLLGLADRAGRLVRPSIARLGVPVLGLLAACSVLAGTGPLLQLVGHVVWATAGTAFVLGWVLVVLVDRPPAVGDGSTVAWRGVTVALVVLVAANGLTPYVQLKTGYGWNMYSNLRVVDGATNHLLVPALDLRGDHDELLAVVDSTDPGVASYAEDGALLPRLQLEDWVVRTPGARVTATAADGTTVELVHGEVRRSRPAWVTTVAPLRPVVDGCLLGYRPAG